jgi:hypothetical protein
LTTDWKKAMPDDELRDTIWGYLYQANEARTLDEIATSLDRDRAAICAAVDHEWFVLQHDQVRIAYTSPRARSTT